MNFSSAPAGANQTRTAKTAKKTVRRAFMLDPLFAFESRFLLHYQCRRQRLHSSGWQGCQAELSAIQSALALHRQHAHTGQPDAEMPVVVGQAELARRRRVSNPEGDRQGSSG